MWRGIGKACGWRRPRALSVRRMFGDEQAAEAVLTFLRDARVGCMVSLAPPEGEEGEGENGEKEGPGPPQNEEVEEGGPGPP